MTFVHECKGVVEATLSPRPSAAVGRVPMMPLMAAVGKRWPGAHMVWWSTPRCVTHHAVHACTEVPIEWACSRRSGAYDPEPWSHRLCNYAGARAGGELMRDDTGDASGTAQVRCINVILCTDHPVDRVARAVAHHTSVEGCPRHVRGLEDMRDMP